MSTPKQRRYIADPHLGHDKVARLRGYATADEHDAAFLAAWARSVPAGAEVFVLGDLSTGALAAEERALELIYGLPGVKHLILGNHDRGHPLHRNGRTRQAAYRDVFATVGTADKVRLAGRDVMLSHFPYAGDHEGTADRHDSWRLRDTGRWLIHGHVHEVWKVRGRQLCVSWDQWPDLFPTDNALADIIARRADPPNAENTTPSDTIE